MPRQTASMDSQVREFYSGKNFLITGGTGLVGLCLLERILCNLPDAGLIYLLMRPKRGKRVEERLNEYLKNPIFETLVRNMSSEDVFKKVIPIAGDVKKPNLGLYFEDRKLIDNVNVIIHAAADIDFEHGLKEAMEVNYSGTQRILELAGQLEGLEAMVHVSTAYANFFVKDPQEILYDIPEDVNQILRQVETLTEDELLLTEPTLLKEHYIFYTFTKQLAEHEVAKHSDKFACAIVRPSLVLPTWKEPMAGWTCSYSGVMGFLVGSSVGLIRRLPLDRKIIADFIPVDVVANQLLVAGWQASKTAGLSIYHCTSSIQKPYRWGQLEDQVNKMIHKFPLKCALWYPYLKMMGSLRLFKISSIFVQVIPAYFLELLLRSTGRSTLSKLQKVFNTLKKLEWFFYSEWKFCNENTMQLSRNMNEIDRKLFYIDISDIDWKEYITNLYFGCRTYLLHENETTLEGARFKNLVLLMLHIIWQTLLIFMVWYFVAYVTGLTLVDSGWCVPVLYILYNFL